jgi:hypothetical protein
VTAEPLPPELQTSEEELLDQETVAASVDPATGRRTISFDGRTDRFTIQSTPGAANDTPYWIMRVPPALIPGHSGFFTVDTLNLISAIVAISGALEPESKTKIMRDDSVRPMVLTALPDGRVLIADASRRIFRIELDIPTPYAFGCLPQIADPAGTVGVTIDGYSGFAVRSRPTTRSSIRGGYDYKTDLLSFSLDGDVTSFEDPIRVQSSERFSAMTYDHGKGRLYLARGGSGEIYVADLFAPTKAGGRKRVKPTPMPWVDLEQTESISDLYYDEGSGVLLALDAGKGDLFAVREKAVGMEVEYVATDLGWPVALTADADRGRIYVGDGKEQRIWQLDCSSDGCTQPTVLLQSDELASPGLMDVAPDGTLWIGDREAGKIVAVSPRGQILQTVAKLPVE